jgi:hypothetical protein
MFNYFIVYLAYLWKYLLSNINIYSLYFYLLTQLIIWVNAYTFKHLNILLLVCIFN